MEVGIMSDISVLGLGKMGTALAKSLLASGRSVTVWNRSANKAQPFIGVGAEVATSAADAISASDVSILCIRNHKTTAELLRPISGNLPGRTLLQLSTGSAKEAEELVDLVTGAGADWLIGMINAYPSGIGKVETPILCASPTKVWDEYGDVIRTLGGASEHVGTSPAAIPGLFAAMFMARQGFMFGMIYGGAVCRNAGVPMDVFVEQFPLTLRTTGFYAETFRRTVPSQSYDSPEATLETYLAALNGVLATFEETGTIDDFPRLLRDLTQRGFDEGHSAKDLTVLVEMLSEKS
jgi:3-hydroxyisobutyrate dehydrogenase-like beta-hydroxyacid dehydrogenase